MNLFMMSWKKIATSLLLLTALSGCSLANKLVYRIDINQGNYVDQSLVQALRFGMTKEQIQFLLGPPMVVEQGFPDVWYYVHWLKPGHKEPEQKSLILDFQDGTLSGMRGNFEPSAEFYEEIGEIS